MYENVSYILLNIHSTYYTFCIIYDIYRVQKTMPDSNGNIAKNLTSKFTRLGLTCFKPGSH